MDYAEFLNELGLWMWDKELIEGLKQSFKNSMWEFNEKAMCRLLKLVAHNHKKDDQFISMIEDALCLRVATSLKEKLPVAVDADSMLYLTEGMSVLSRSRKPLNDLLKRLLLQQDAQGDNFINLNPRLCLQVASLIDDFEVVISTKIREILNTAIVESHIKPGNFSLKDLSYIALC
jgi:hypothetical protein